MKRSKKSKPWVAWLLLLLVTVVLTLAAALAGAKLIYAQALPESKMNLVAYLAIAVVALLIAMFTALKQPQKRFLFGLLAAVGYALMLMLCNLLFFGEGFGAILPNAAAILGGGFLGALLGAGKRRKSS